MRVKFLMDVRHKRNVYKKDSKVILEDALAQYFVLNGWAVDTSGTIKSRIKKVTSSILKIDKANHAGETKWVR